MNSNLPVKKVVLANVVPAMLVMVMTLVYNIADLLFIGQTGDPLQVAAVSIATPIFLILLSMGNIFGIGGTSLISRSLGSGNDGLVKKVSSFCYWCCIVIGVLLSAAMFVGADAIVNMLGASGDVAPMVKTYLQYLCLSGPFIIISNCYSNILRAENQAKKAMIGMLIGNAVNIALDPVLILWLGLGVEGAAIATMIGNICGGVYYLVYIFKGNSILSTKIKDFTIAEGILKNVLLIGIPASLTTVFTSASQMILNIQMAQYGDLAIAGVGVATKVTMITSMICIGIGLGAQPLLGFAIGAKDETRYKELLRFSVLFAFAFSGVLTAVCYLFLTPIVSAFLTDAAAFDYAFSFSKIMLSTGPLIGMFIVISSALQAAGAASYSLIVNTSRQGIVYIPLVYILGSVVGINGLIAAQPIADVITCVITIFLYSMLRKNLFTNATADVSQDTAADVNTDVAANVSPAVNTAVSQDIAADVNKVTTAKAS
ncbi:MAG: hypothetical protein BEN18_02710 [Epulopiscium sp. Nuni2H_MBin001]|nr:MAG: hypothetical protein BEN18_02710 [Epulopiscium sp. Nuni2H_MBin001]